MIVVQGFETSRFLGAEHPGAERIRSMRLAQWISSGVYLLFIALITVMFHASAAPESQEVTAIISIAGSIIAVLGTLVAITAIGSRFTAATADEAGCSGLLETPVSRIIPGSFVYAVVASFAILVTWVTDVLQIISYASRALALFYACQRLAALLTALRRSAAEEETGAGAGRILGFGLLGALSLAVSILGIPAG